jgi:general stress protein YciG
MKAHSEDRVNHGEISVREAGRRGGKATAEKFGPEHFRALQARSAAKVAATDPGLYARIGAKGGTSTWEHHGFDHYRAIGKAGGERTKLIHGSEHYREAGRRGGLAGRRVGS